MTLYSIAKHSREIERGRLECSGVDFILELTTGAFRTNQIRFAAYICKRLFYIYCGVILNIPINSRSNLWHVHVKNLNLPVKSLSNVIRRLRSLLGYIFNCLC